jgi:DNA-binding NtrC family response regulator
MTTRPLHILLIEDDPATLQTLGGILSKRNHKVSLASTGQDALTLAREKSFDLIISDISLPDTNGWVLLTELHKLHRDVPAIAYTGHGYERDFALSDASGFMVHLTKPVTIEQLDEAIDRLFPGTCA